MYKPAILDDSLLSLLRLVQCHFTAHSSSCLVRDPVGQHTLSGVVHNLKALQNPLQPVQGSHILLGELDTPCFPPCSSLQQARQKSLRCWQDLRLVVQEGEGCPGRAHKDVSACVLSDTLCWAVPLIDTCNYIFVFVQTNIVA